MQYSNNPSFRYSFILLYKNIDIRIINNILSIYASSTPIT